LLVVSPSGIMRAGTKLETSGAMSKRHETTLEELFDDPVRANINWRDVESLLNALGADLSEGSGSRVRVALNGVRATFHRPHPEKEIGKATVRSIRTFLSNAGVR
jgi:hypothetical protein